MCIRDRQVTGRHQRLHQADIAQRRGLHKQHPTPVSYTHLDVYKRQALLETLRIAATGFGLTTKWAVASDPAQRLPVYTVQLLPAATLLQDPLFDYITSRAVQRRPMQTTPLTDQQRHALGNAAGDGFDVQWCDSAAQRRQIAALLWASARTVSYTHLDVYKRQVKDDER